MTAEVEIIVEPQARGRRLDAVLGADARIGSRARAQALIERGDVAVDGQTCAKSHRLAGGERIRARLDLEPTTDPAQGAHEVLYGVCYEDDFLLVVDKPPGLVVHPARGHRSGTLSQALEARGARSQPPWRPALVHRLDRDTSGLLVVAKSERVQRALQALIRTRTLLRQYTALVSGHPAARTATIDAAIGRDRRRRTQIGLASDRPRAARTHFSVVETHPETALLSLRLETGRTHQIRVHLAAIGHPVCGDPQYAGTRCGRRVGLGRQFLHAARVAFDHPCAGERLEFDSELPTDLAAALERARRGDFAGSRGDARAATRS